MAATAASRLSSGRSTTPGLKQKQLVEKACVQARKRKVLNGESPEGHLNLDEGLITIGQEIFGLSGVNPYHAYIEKQGY